MAAVLKDTGHKLGGAFVEIRASLHKLKSGLATARSLVASSMRGLSKIATLPITISIKAVRSALSAAVTLVRNAMYRIKQLMFVSGIGGGALLWGFARFETAMRKATAVSETTGEQFKQMSEMARTQAMRLNKSAAELAEGFYYLGSAGLSVSDQIKAFPAVATLAKAAVIDMGAATEMVVDTMKGFRIGFENTTHVTDVMAKAVTSSNQTFAQLGEALSYVSGVAQMTNNTLEDTIAALAKMADVGIKGSRGGIYMRTGLLRLMAPMSQAQQELEKLGVSIYDSTGRMKPFVQLVGELGDALQGVSEQQRNMAFKALFGQRAISGQIAIFRDGKKAMQEFADMIRKAAGATEQIAQKQLNSLGQQFGRLIKIITNTAITLGRAFGPALREMVGDLQKQFKRLDDFFKKHELTIAAYVRFGYAYLKHFGTFVIQIGTDIANNWSERWEFMRKVVGIQVRAAADIIRSTFDDVWAVLKSGAVAYGKTLYLVFKKVFVDVASNIGRWLRDGFEKGKDYVSRYHKELTRLQDEWLRQNKSTLERLPLNALKAMDELEKRLNLPPLSLRSAIMRAKGGGEIPKDVMRKLREEAQRLAQVDLPKADTWREVGQRAAEAWRETYEKSAASIKRILNTITDIEKKAAEQIASALPKAWKDKWQDFKLQLEEAKAEIQLWYDEQVRAAKKAGQEIEKAQAEPEAARAPGVVPSAEMPEPKTAAIVGVKELWQRTVESLYGRDKQQLEELSKQTDLLADIEENTGQTAEIPEIPEIPAVTMPDIGLDKYTKDTTAKFRDYIKAKTGNFRAYLDKVLGRRERPEIPESAVTQGRRGPQIDRQAVRKARKRERFPEQAVARKKVPPKLEREKDDWTEAEERRAIRQKIKERKEQRDSVEALERHRREHPDWKPTAQPKQPEVAVVVEGRGPQIEREAVQKATDYKEKQEPEPIPPKLEIKPIEVEPEPQAMRISVSEPKPIEVDMPKIEPPETEPLQVDMPQITAPKVETSIAKPEPIELAAPNIKWPKMPQIDIRKPKPIQVDVPEVKGPDLRPLDVKMPGPIDVPIPRDLGSLGVDMPAMPQFKWPQMPQFKWPQMPQFKWPKPQQVWAKLEQPQGERIEVEKAEALSVERPLPELAVEPSQAETPKVEISKAGPLEVEEPGALKVEKAEPIIVNMPKVKPLTVPDLPELGVNIPRIEVPKIEAPRIKPMHVEMPKVQAPQIPPLTVDMPKVEKQEKVVTIQGASDAALLKEARQLVAEVRQVNASIKKLAPVGATGP